MVKTAKKPNVHHIGKLISHDLCVNSFLIKVFFVGDTHESLLFDKDLESLVFRQPFHSSSTSQEWSQGIHSDVKGPQKPSTIDDVQAIVESMVDMQLSLGQQVEKCS